MARALNPDYLGDGVYATAEEDGSIMLTTGHYDQMKASAVVFLEPDTIEALIRYYKRSQEER